MHFYKAENEPSTRHRDSISLLVANDFLLAPQDSQYASNANFVRHLFDLAARRIRLFSRPEFITVIFVSAMNHRIEKSLNRLERAFLASTAKVARSSYANASIKLLNERVGPFPHKPQMLTLLS